MSGSWNGGGGDGDVDGDGNGSGETEVAKFARSLSQTVGRSVEDAASTVSRALHLGKNPAADPATSASSTSLVTLADGAPKRLRVGRCKLDP